MLFKRKWGFYFLTVALCLSLMSSVNAFHDDNDNTQSNYFHKGYIGTPFCIYLDPTWGRNTMASNDYIEMGSWDEEIVQLDHIQYRPWYYFTDGQEYAYFEIVGKGTTTITVHRPPLGWPGDTYECEVVGRNWGEPL